jgi:hypothetical protein
MMDMEQLRAERDARKAALQAARDEQRLADFTRLNELELEHGDDNVAAVEVQRYAPGLTTLVVVRALRRVELKRWRDKTSKDKADQNAAADEAGLCALLYPERESAEWAAICDLVPGVVTRAGLAAVQLAAGVEQLEGKV